VVTASVPTLQTAPCWIAITSNGRYAYSSNTGSGTVTGFRVQEDGTLTLLNKNGITGVTGGSTIDAAVVGDKFLYVLSDGHNQGESLITGFAIGNDGSLSLIGSAGSLPGSTVGLAAR
jgi:6-phosphogluconolactonase